MNTLPIKLKKIAINRHLDIRCLLMEGAYEDGYWIFQRGEDPLYLGRRVLEVVRKLSKIE